MTVLVVGAGFIGTAIASELGPHGRLVPHGAVAENVALLHGVTAVIHAGRHPALGQAGWRIEEDVEPRIAARAADHALPFLSLGTRKVYAPSGQPLCETSPLGPTDRYGEQKLALEERLQAILGPLLTRLRIANIIGWELVPGRGSFLGRALGTLAAEGVIRFDMDPAVPRDFLPVKTCAMWIGGLAVRPPGGVVNLGSGIALPCGDLAQAIIAGHGRGRLIVTDASHRDAFVMHTARLQSLIPDAAITRADLLAYLHDLGRRLAQHPG